MAIDTNSFGDKTKLLSPFACRGIMHGTLYVLLVLVALDAQGVSGAAEQSRRGRTIVWIMAGGAAGLSRLGIGNVIWIHNL
jgi:hypothetical protein